jgi:hypothetical protein
MTEFGSGSEWKITERSVEVAQSRAFIWLTFAHRALKRTRLSGPVLGGLVTESWSCVLALNHIRMCGDLAVRTATVPAAKAEAEAGLRAFDQDVPSLRDVRNALEHDEDDYLLGMGHLQQRGTKRRQRAVDQSRAEQWNFEPHFIGHDTQRPAVRLGNEIFIDLTLAVEAAARLQRSLYRAASIQGVTASGLATPTA